MIGTIDIQGFRITPKYNKENELVSVLIEAETVTIEDVYVKLEGDSAKKFYDFIEQRVKGFINQLPETPVKEIEAENSDEKFTPEPLVVFAPQSGFVPENNIMPEQIAKANDDKAM